MEEGGDEWRREGMSGGGRRWVEEGGDEWRREKMSGGGRG